ncbi:hypothetical protein [Streptacidiphilus cavernicola]|uniref:Uncharacterized protein n=1 Tax=Streptacidiphilus cavernicola TaxID=3342716 RepID=A0ABV6VY34_9ACTN
MSVTVIDSLPVPSGYDPNRWQLSDLADRDIFSIEGTPGVRYAIIATEPGNLTGMVKVDAVADNGLASDRVTLDLPYGTWVHAVQRIREYTATCILCKAPAAMVMDTADRSQRLNAHLCDGHLGTLTPLPPRDWDYALFPAPESDDNEEPEYYRGQGLGVTAAIRKLLQHAIERADGDPHLELWTRLRRDGTTRSVPVLLASVASGAAGAHDVDVTGEGRTRLRTAGARLPEILAQFDRDRRERG